MLPTFLIAGVAKAGTTSLYRYLNEHPEIDMSAVKEPRFFTKGCELWPDQEADASQAGFWNDGIDWYESLYSHSKPDNARGEATSYLHYTDAPALIYSTVPAVRLIFILRHPVDRVFSAYWQDMKMGRRLPGFDQAVMRGHPRIWRHVDMSAYGHHLPRFYAAFREDQILLLLFEDLGARPQEVLHKAFQHIGVDPSFEPSGLEESHNSRMLPRSHALQVAAMRAARSLRSARLPRAWKDGLQKAGRLVLSANMSHGGQPVMRMATRRVLLERFDADVQYVEEKLGRDLMDWRG